jgi:hypothetical protein
MVDKQWLFPITIVSKLLDQPARKNDMPTISQFFGVVIQMFWREHASPHFHGEYEALIDIRTLKVIKSASNSAHSFGRMAQTSIQSGYMKRSGEIKRG